MKLSPLPVVFPVRVSHKTLVCFFVFVYYYRAIDFNNPKFSICLQRKGHFNLVMINDTIMKYENKEKHRIYIKTLVGKNHKQDESENDYRLQVTTEYIINPKMLIL